MVWPPVSTFSLIWLYLFAECWAAGLSCIVNDVTWTSLNVERVLHHSKSWLDRVFLSNVCVCVVNTHCHTVVPGLLHKAKAFRHSIIHGYIYNTNFHCSSFVIWKCPYVNVILLNRPFLAFNKHNISVCLTMAITKYWKRFFNIDVRSIATLLTSQSYRMWLDPFFRLIE